MLVLTSDRGLAGAYNGSVLRAANIFIKEQEVAGKKIELYVSGKKGINYFNFQKRAIAEPSGSISFPTRPNLRKWIAWLRNSCSSSSKGKSTKCALLT